MSGRIVWLASYPKSGNTWFRVFLDNLLSDSDRPVDINGLVHGTAASSRSLFDEISGLSSSDLSQDEIEVLRPRVYRLLSDRARETVFLKIHDALRPTPAGELLVPPEATAGVIYLVRDPLDVVLSLANHEAIDPGEAIRLLNDEAYGLCLETDRATHQLRQRILSWSEHVTTWTTDHGMRLHLVRYEDLKQDPVRFFAGAVAFLGLGASRDEIERAVELSRIERLQSQEREHGFREKSPKTGEFFFRGEVGRWREALSVRQVDEVVAAHGAVMQRLGYVGPRGEVDRSPGDRELAE